MKIKLANGTERMSNLIVEQACVTFDKHTQFLDFSVIKLPKYEAILGKPWLDRWNPKINWKKNTMEWKMGNKIIAVTRVKDPHNIAIVSSIFQRSCIVEEIQAQQMRKLAKKDAVFLVVVREMNEEPRNEQIVTINDDQI